jgi:hypothetical protein
LPGFNLTLQRSQQTAVPFARGSKGKKAGVIGPVLNPDHQPLGRQFV